MTNHPWFGDWFSKWPVVPARRVCRLGTGHTPDRSEPAYWSPEDCILPWVTVADIHRLGGSGLSALEDTEQHVSEVGLANSAAVLHPAGSVMVSRTASIGFACRIGRPMATTQAFATWTPGPSVESRYLLLVMKALAPEFERLAYGSTHLTIYMPDIESIRMPLPPLVSQRAIADLVEHEAERIDSLIAARRRFLALLEERADGAFESALARRGFVFPASLDPDWSAVTLPHGWRVLRLSRTLSRLTNGYVGPTRDILRDDGIRYIQSLHIKGGKIDFPQRPFFVDEQWHRDRPRVHLRPHDVLIVQTGDIGQVAVVSEGFGEASCHALQIARVDPRMVSGPYLGAYLRSRFGYHSLLSRATGALHPHLEAGILDVPVVVPPRDVQANILDEVERDQAPIADTVAAVQKQSRLLRERRDAITAEAVTGRLDLPKAA